MCVLTGFSITTASFAIYEVTEHQKGSKRLQHIAGISESFYWIVNFIYDMVTSYFVNWLQYWKPCVQLNFIHISFLKVIKWSDFLLLHRAPPFSIGHLFGPRSCDRCCDCCFPDSSIYRTPKFGCRHSPPGALWVSNFEKSRFTNCSHIVVVLECILLTKMYLIMNQSFMWVKILENNLLEIVLCIVAILLDCFPLWKQTFILF